VKTAYIIAALLAAGFLAGYVTAVFWAPTFFPNIFKAVAQQGNVREYTIIIQPAQIELAPELSGMRGPITGRFRAQLSTPR
jgi:hypothetical protein